jgi:hypothetical protein
VLNSADPDILVIHYVNLSDYCNAKSPDGSLTNECHEVGLHIVYNEELIGIIPGHSLEIHCCNPLTVEIYIC